MLNDQYTRIYLDQERRGEGPASEGSQETAVAGEKEGAEDKADNGG